MNEETVEAYIARIEAFKAKAAAFLADLSEDELVAVLGCLQRHPKWASLWARHHRESTEIYNRVRATMENRLQ